MAKALIIPTGDEILDGTVLDTDSGAVMTALLSLDPALTVVRHCPMADTEETILSLIESAFSEGYNYILLMGGSGGGHRFSPTLGYDFTHTALDMFFKRHGVAAAESRIYGKNGHLWCRLLLGNVDSSLICSLPGPYTEASAAAACLVRGLKSGKALNDVMNDMQQAIASLYGERVSTKKVL